MSESWRVVFMGTPEFAGPSLAVLAGSENRIDLVMCQPDRPKGRGRKLSPPPGKTLAQSLGLPVWQPESLKNPGVYSRISELAPDLLVVVAFGLMLPTNILNLPRVGVLNVHPSLLPAYRGPAPINWAIINGETKTGVTTMFLDQGMDTGPTLLSQKTEIGQTETAGELQERLAGLGAQLLLQTITGLKTGTVKPHPQPEKGASVCRLLKKSDGLIDWSRPADKLSALVRGTDPWPGAFTSFNDKNLKLFGARSGSGRGTPGRILALQDGRLHVATGQGSLALDELQLEGKKRQKAKDFWHGQRLSQADSFGV